MFQLLKIGVLILVNNHLAKTLNITSPDVFQKCALYSDEFWDVYIKHFRLVTLLKFTILQTKEHKFDVHQFSQNLFRVLMTRRLHYLDSYYYTIKVRREFLTKPSKTAHEYGAVRHRVLFQNNFKIKDDEELIRIKRLTSDSVVGYVVVVWDVDDLRSFLDENYEKVIPKVRATYAVFFVFSTTKLCSSIHEQIHYILNRFWVQYNVINVVAQTLCSCDTTQVYIHRPFVKIEDSWGVTNNYTMTESSRQISLITSVLSNLNQYQLPVSLFEKVPTAVKTLPKLLKTNPLYRDLSWSQGFAGADAMLLGTLAKCLNFTPVVDLNLPLNDFGHVLKNGTVSGVLGDVIKRRSQLGVNERFLANYGVGGFEFTMPHGSDKICFMVPKARKVPRWRTLFMCFGTCTWIMITGVYFTCVVFWYLVRSSTLLKTSWEMYSFLMGIPYRVVPSVPQFFYLTGCMIFNVIIMGVIQGSLFTNFSTITFYHDLDTLDDVDQSGITIMSYVWHLIQDDSDLIKRLKKKSILFDPGFFEAAARDRNLGIMDRKSDLEIFAKAVYLEDDGTPRFHIVNECLTTFLVVNIVPKGSAFLTMFNTIITKVVESGLWFKWYKDVADSIFIEKSNEIMKKESFKAFSFDDVQAPFYILVFGYGCGILIFLGEIFLKRV